MRSHLITKCKETNDAFRRIKFENLILTYKPHRMRLFATMILGVLLIISCSKEDNDNEKNKALTTFESTNKDSIVIAKKKTPVQNVYPYSNLEFELVNKITKPQTIKDNLYKFQYDSVTCLLNNKKAPVVFQFSIKNDTNLIAKVKSTDYFSASGKITFTVYGSWHFSSTATPGQENWAFLKTATKTLEFDLYDHLLPKTAIKNSGNSQLNTDQFYRPYVQINYAPDKEIKLPESNENIYFKFQVISGLDQSGNKINVTQQVVGDSVMYLNYVGMLSPNTAYTLNASVKWYISKGTPFVWEECNDKFNETVTQKITTGASTSLEGSLADSDVDFMYPLNRQFNYLKAEYEKGYIKFKNIKAQKWFEAHLPTVEIENVKTGIKTNSATTYNATYGIIEYDLKASFLNNNEVYRISFIDQVSSTKKYEYYFKTSQYNSFTEKWNVLKNIFKDKWRDYDISFYSYPYMHVQGINVTIDNGEILDHYEVLTDPYKSETLSLIQFETHVPESWKNTVEWLIYSQPSLKLTRYYNTIKFGFPPLRAIFFEASERWAIKLSNQSLTGSIEYPEMPWRGVFSWEVQNLMGKDATSAKMNAWSIPESDQTEWQKLAANDYPDIPRLYLDFALGGDTYPLLDVYYVLPGINKETTKIKDVQL